MRRNVCFVVGAGENYGLDVVPHKGDMTIAADAGLRYLEQKEIAADLVIGDFDSLRFKPQHKNVIELNPEKDITDMRAAVHEGIKAGYDLFYIYCGMGGRIDHTIANIQLLSELSKSGKQGFLVGRDNIITAITDRSLSFLSGISGFISVFSYSELSKGVCLDGLKYELDNAELTNDFPLGVSNEFTGKESKIRVKKGTLLIVFPKEAKEMVKL